MEIDDRYVTAAPEGVHLEIVLAGLGSRFCAYLLDFLIQGAAFVVFLFALSQLTSHAGPTGQLIGDGALGLFLFMDYIGYFVLFELLWSGRSPGKRLTGIRVVKAGGQPVGFWASLVRNLGRLLDALPTVDCLGIIMILATTRNQRLGDLMAGTVVVRDRLGVTPPSQTDPWTSGRAFQAAAWVAPAQYFATPGQAWLPPEIAHWDVSAVSAQDWAMARTFLSNRFGYTPDARNRLAVDLANRIWPFVSGPPSPPPPELFLEMAVHVKTVRG